MSAEFVGPDVLGGLHLLAELYQQRWLVVDAHLLVKIAAEIRQGEVRFGLSPMDRRRLQWEIEKGETAAERTERRRQQKRTPAETGADPREVLKLSC